MKKTIGEMKDTVGAIKQSLDVMKGDLQGALYDAKDTAAEVKDTMSYAKSTFGRDSLTANAEVEVTVEKEGEGFVIRGSDGVLGEITYATVDEGTWVLNHTYVKPRYRGRDLAQRMLRRVAEEARMEGKKIIPACSYAHVQFRRNLEYADVWHQQEH